MNVLLKERWVYDIKSIEQLSTVDGSSFQAPLL